ncbi:MAG: NAD+ synthase [Gemmatimonadetes bacterium]|uniref:Glutamine-dependent NAD(+) synthetase n=1 Tax=Candidatus Kutchimonas denitrificans TaxID=3056748 RepID=A0AAE4Z9L7_9BACT|nr:NAD+ synthase [Gemmatimonadota bacterium]NIR76310.1 NAD+ synthase [Candidatus Kutchimonas denitrificans]NIS02333.1 NAD+ synthase [Gemmatimonadota bacterium]NIT68152.1 NAD+ synthase [Gemmatimonadota bacterium]NIU54376.1 NAD+ synthase [Gemmatimonadota bacterium]
MAKGLSGEDRIIRVALCQRNLFVGDIPGNVAKIRQSLAGVKDAGADLVLFPELTITGYPPEDLLLKPYFAEKAAAALYELANEVEDVVAVVGFPQLLDDLFNTAAVIAGGEVAAVYRKRYLPNYGPFDEQRYFARGDDALVLDMDGVKVGVTICEDLWYPGGPAEWAVLDGDADVLVNLSASPYHRGKGPEREEMLATRCEDYSCYLAFCNMVGGQDELLFDGHSVVIDPRGVVLGRCRQFEEDTLVMDLDLRGVSRRRLHDPRWRQRHGSKRDQVRVVPVRRARRKKPKFEMSPPVQVVRDEAEVYAALVLGTADYFRKNAFDHAVLGVSGGIDSALALAVAVDALGSEAVTAVSMPSRYTAQHNREDAAECARRVGVDFKELPIDGVFGCYLDALEEPFAGTDPNVAEENIQARIRGNVLMALSNKFGWLVLATGNKSEYSVGYATLYGDMAGGFAILKDVSKTWVYRLARWRNRTEEVVPPRVLEKPPTAELRAGQLDSDTLPPYEVLDPILEAYVEEDRSPEEIEKMGFDRELVYRVAEMVDRAEYKRRQAPPGIRISPRAFGRDRRLPITNGYRSGVGSGD